MIPTIGWWPTNIEVDSPNEIRLYDSRYNYASLSSSLKAQIATLLHVNNGDEIKVNIMDVDKQVTKILFNYVSDIILSII